MLQQLFNTLAAQSSMESMSPSLSSTSEETVEVGTSNDGKELVVPNDDKEGIETRLYYVFTPLLID